MHVYVGNVQSTAIRLTQLGDCIRDLLHCRDMFLPAETMGQAETLNCLIDAYEVEQCQCKHAMYTYSNGSPTIKIIEWVSSWLQYKEIIL